jgi:hypothetical protein
VVLDPRDRSCDPYEARPIRFLELWEPHGWRLKVYGITYGRDVVDPELLTAVCAVVGEKLGEIGQSVAHYGVGFLGVHQGKTGNFGFVGFWADENELHYHVWISPSHAPSDLRYVTPTGRIACVWDTYLIGFERDAWVDCVLRQPTDFDAYTQRRLNELV